MKLLNEELGSPLTAPQVAEYLGMDVKTVRKYYIELGGIRIGTQYLFFEREVLNAIQKRKEIHRTDKEERAKNRKSIHDKEGSSGLGSRNAKNARVPWSLKRVALENFWPAQTTQLVNQPNHSPQALPAPNARKAKLLNAAANVAKCFTAAPAIRSVIF